MMSNSEYNPDELMIEEESDEQRKAQQHQHQQQSYTKPAEMGKEVPDSDSEQLSQEEYSDSDLYGKNRRGRRWRIPTRRERDRSADSSDNVTVPQRQRKGRAIESEDQEED